MTSAPPKPPVKKPRRKIWVEQPDGHLLHIKGYTLTRVPNTKGWRLCDPSGEYIITQVELPDGMLVVVDWADQYIKYIEALD